MNKLKGKKKVKLVGHKRSSDMLMMLKTKTHKGPRTTIVEPLVIQEDEEGTLTQEDAKVGSDPKLGTCVRAMKSWSNISRA
ncbi:unnamed protein product [Lathyrus sativus]|nr:unnamed protein product [Lathyrus sativus]